MTNRSRIATSFSSYYTDIPLRSESSGSSKISSSSVSTNRINAIKKKEGIVNLILQTFTNIDIRTTIFSGYMAALTSAYFWSETLQSSNLISSDAHNNNTATSFSYDLITAWLVSYFLLNIQSIYSRNIPDGFLYWLFVHVGALGFAMLGQVPFLKNLAIVKGFWKHLTPPAWFTIIFFGAIIVYVAIREFYDCCRNRTFKYSMLNLMLVEIAYCIMLYTLTVGGAKDIHYHIHHAIFAGVLSLWFSNWSNNLELILNAILMGIVVEGINFYGVGELYLFLTNNSTPMLFSNALTISTIFTSIILFLYIISYCIKR